MVIFITPVLAALKSTEPRVEGKPAYVLVALKDSYCTGGGLSLHPHPGQTVEGTKCQARKTKETAHAKIIRPSAL